MSPALADLPLRKVLDALEKAGFRHVRTKGSHAVYRGLQGNVVVVPQHATIKRGHSRRYSAKLDLRRLSSSPY